MAMRCGVRFDSGPSYSGMLAKVKSTRYIAKNMNDPTLLQAAIEEVRSKGFAKAACPSDQYSPMHREHYCGARSQLAGAIRN